MNTHRAVRQYLAKEENKTELKAERFELTVVADLKKLQAQIETLSANSISRAKKLEARFQNSNNANIGDNDEAEKLSKQMFMTLSDASAQAKGLGLTLPKEWENMYDTSRKLIAKIPVSNLANIYSV